jgi:putative intracellular protease/amidase
VNQRRKAVDMGAMPNPRSFLHFFINASLWLAADTLAQESTITAARSRRSAAQPTSVPISEPAPGGIGSTVPPDLNGYKTVIAPPTNPAALQIAIFDGKGAPMSGIENVRERVNAMPGSTITLLKADAIAQGGLSGYDVVIFSGGSGGTQAKSLGDQGREQVRKFVREGGGYVGICAGAYLACSNFSWGLQILNASTVSSKWMRGSGFVEEEITFDGSPILGAVDGTFFVRYNNGPIIKPGDRADLPAYRPLSLFRTEVAKNGTPVGIMLNAPAQAVSTYGKGRVFISSPHPENTPGLEHLIPRGILWAAGKLEEQPNTSSVP